MKNSQQSNLFKKKDVRLQSFEIKIYSINQYENMESFMNDCDSLKGYKWIEVFLICLFFGLFGIHRVCVGQYFMGILYMCTLGLFGIGYLLDIFKLLNGSFKDSEGNLIKR